VHAVLPEKEQPKYARCNYNNPVSLVTGKTEISELIFCQVLRESTSDSRCGVVGRFYEEKTNV
jgi:hypothetical protein